MLDHPSSPSTAIQDAWNLVAKGLTDQAEHAFSSLLHGSDRSAALEGLGAVATRRGDISRAADLFAQACEASPNRAMPHYQLGVAMIALGRAEPALRALSRCVELDPALSEGWFNLGSLHRQLGRFADAVPCFRRAAEGRVGDVARLALVATLRSGGSADEAISVAREMLSARESWPEAWHELGLCLAAKGDVLTAISCWERSIELAPTATEPRFHLGVAHASIGSIDKGVAEYRMVLERSPDHARARINLAGAMIHQGDLDGAERELERVLRSPAPEAPMALVALGDLMMRRGDAATAERRYRDAIGRMPREARPRVGLIASLLEQDRGEDALVESERFARELPDRPEIGECRAEALLFLGRIPEAVSQIDQVVSRHGPNVLRFCLRGRVLEAAGDRNGAIAAYDAALAIDPRFIGAIEGRARLGA